MLLSHFRLIIHCLVIQVYVLDSAQISYTASFFYTFFGVRICVDHENRAYTVSST